MSISVVANISEAGQSTFTTPNVDTTLADLIVLVVCHLDSSVPTLSDNQSNSYTSIASQAVNNLVQQMFWVAAPTVGGTHNWTLTGTSHFSSICVLALAGVNATPLDQVNGAASASVSTLQPGSITPTEDDEIIITGCGVGSGEPTSINGGFTISDSEVVTGSNFGAGLAYLIQTTKTAANPTWTNTQSTNVGATIVSFKQAAVAGFVPYPNPRYEMQGGMQPMGAGI